MRNRAFRHDGCIPDVDIDVADAEMIAEDAAGGCGRAGIETAGRASLEGRVRPRQAPVQHRQDPLRRDAGHSYRRHAGTLCHGPRQPRRRAVPDAAAERLDAGAGRPRHRSAPACGGRPGGEEHSRCGRAGPGRAGTSLEDRDHGESSVLGRRDRHRTLSRAGRARQLHAALVRRGGLRGRQGNERRSGAGRALPGGRALLRAPGQCDAVERRQGVGYIVGLAKNARLNDLAAPWMETAAQGFAGTGFKQRLFGEFAYAAGSRL